MHQQSWKTFQNVPDSVSENVFFLQVPGSEDVPGEVAGAAPAEDGLGGEGGGGPRDGRGGDHQPNRVATNKAKEATTATLEDYSGENNKIKP